MKFLTLFTAAYTRSIRSKHSLALGKILEIHLTARQKDKGLVEVIEAQMEMECRLRDSTIQAKEAEIAALLNSKKEEITALLSSKKEEIATLLSSKKETVELECRMRDSTIQAKEAEIAALIKSNEKEIRGKDIIIESKEVIILSAKNELELTKNESVRIKAAYDFLKSKLDGRHILEAYEALFKKGGSRLDKWERHLKSYPRIDKVLRECEDVNWAPKIEDIYRNLSREIHLPTLDLGNGDFLVQIEKHSAKDTFWLMQMIAREIYGSHVRIQEIQVEHASEMQ